MPVLDHHPSSTPTSTSKTKQIIKHFVQKQSPTEKMVDPSSSLINSQSVENVITRICIVKELDPPDSWARQRLAAIDEATAIEILSKIYNQQTQIRDFSRLIVWFIDNPQSPVRGSSQQSSRSPTLFHPQSPSNISSPLRRSSPSFSDNAHASASSSALKGSGSSSLHVSRHTMPPIVPCPQMENLSKHKVSRQLSFSGETEIRERLGPTSHQLTVLSQLEFRKFFLLLSYIGRKKLEEVINLDDIVRRKDLSMGDFEFYIWNTYGQHFCEKPDVRREYADWESGRTYFYYCDVYGDGSYSFKGPCLSSTKTHLQRELGDDNVLVVKFVGEGKHSVLKIAREGILVGLRHYRLFGEVFDPSSD